MKKFILGLLGAVGLISQSSATTQANPGDMSKELRTMVLKLNPSDIGINKKDYPHKVWGIVMETGAEKGYCANRRQLRKDQLRPDGDERRRRSL